MEVKELFCVFVSCFYHISSALFLLKIDYCVILEYLVCAVWTPRGIIVIFRQFKENKTTNSDSYFVFLLFGHNEVLKYNI